MKIQIKKMNVIKIFGLCISPILGIFMMSWIVWSRFIRERLPKDIPFLLTEECFYILIYICCIYLVVIYSLIGPKEQNKIIKKLIDRIYLPLITFNKFIKNNKYITLKYIKFTKEKVHP